MLQNLQIMIGMSFTGISDPLKIYTVYFNH